MVFFSFYFIFELKLFLWVFFVFTFFFFFAVVVTLYLCEQVITAQNFNRKNSTLFFDLLRSRLKLWGVGNTLETKKTSHYLTIAWHSNTGVGFQKVKREEKSVIF